MDALILFSLAGIAIFSAVQQVINNERYQFIMAKVSQIPALLEPIKTQLVAHGEQLTASSQQLEKAKTEIINAVQNVELSPEATAAIESLGAVAAGLTQQGAAVAAVSAALDALNEDAPPADPPSDPPAEPPATEAVPA